ncbi:hypothetical protein [Erythrobacter sp. JK5]|uniref:hypothetical protein n=1 Tax=Erythrobacter sp. JK5 TaxID=2829500 RepID=UPI001BABBEBD|nr:hypothetical protein [Erythrobacter sp. JK5]QUL37629.1 hypothetical protein KDC96_14990 [Erythrobacter sp. JK5]
MKAAIVLIVSLASASSSVSDRSALPFLPEACEVSLALSAAPEWLREDAGVYVLGRDGFRLERESSNKFTCIVNRDHPRVLKPTCFDAEGTTTIIPKIVHFGNRLAQGEPVDAVAADVSQRFDSGQFISPRRPGVAYMLSRYNRPVNWQTGELGFFPPHVMFYAPDLTNEDIGHDMSRHDPARPLPMIAYGGPQGYMLMISDDGTPRSRVDLDTSCPDWIWDEGD